MSSNKEVIQKMCNHLLEIGAVFSSKDYMFYILSWLNEELKAKYVPAKYIKFEPSGVVVSEDVNSLSKDQIGKFLKALLDNMGVKIIYLEFKNHLDQNFINEMGGYGVKI